MKSFFLSGLLLLAFHATAQQTSPRRFSVGLQASVDYSYRRLFHEPVVTDVFDEAHTAKPGGRLGVVVSYAFTPHWSLETGLAYANRGYQTKWRDFTFTVPEPSAPTRAKFVYNYYWLDVPLRLNHTFGSGSFRWLAVAGASANIYLRNETVSYLDFSGRIEKSKTEDPFAQFNPVAFSPELGFGAQWPVLGGRINLRAVPTARYQLADGTNHDLWSVGVELGAAF
jgi:hypothetical protein